MRLSLLQKTLIAVSLLIVGELAFFSGLTYLLVDAENQLWHASHARTLVSQTNAVLKLFVDSASALLGFGATHNTFFEDRYTASVEKIPLELRSLRMLALSDPEVRQELSVIENLSNRALTLLTATKEALDRGRVSLGFFKARDLIAEVEAVITQLIGKMQSFIEHERQRESRWAETEGQSRWRVKQFLAVGVVAHVCMVLAVAVLFARAIVRRLGTVVDNTRRMVERKPLAKPLGGTDEIAHLDHVFHDMAEALRAAERVKQEFVSTISHELRTPLSSIGATLTTLGSGVYGQLTELGLQRVAIAERNTTRLIGLINELLDIKKLEAGKLAMYFQEVALQDVLVSACATVKEQAEKKNVTLMYCPDTAIELTADPGRMEQVVVNLLSNAIKYAPAGTAVTISPSLADEWVEVRIGDQGPGVPEQFKASIFERFEQVDPLRKEEAAGTGLGLPICKAIVEQHGGTIGVESEEGKGSTFWFRLPRAGPAKSAEG